MDAKTFSCTAIAAVSVGVAVGLVASSVTNLHVATGSQVARPVVLTNAAPAVTYAPRDALVARAAQNDVQVESQIPASNNWAIAALASASAAVGAVVLAMRSRATSAYESVREDPEAVLAGAGRVMGAAVIGAAVAGSAYAVNPTPPTYDELQSLSYLEVKGTGLAAPCPILGDSTGTKLSLKAGQYQITNMCLEPNSFKVRLPAKEGKVTDFQKTTLLTRLTYVLDQIKADLTVGGDGSWTIKETGGMDYAATTVQLAGGERVPFLFTIRNMEAKGDAGQFLGQFEVPSYRGATFMDPKGRGGATGYDTAIALQTAQQDEEYAKENLKNLAGSTGTIAFKVAKVNSETGEIGGVFESIQPTDNDMGAKAYKDLKTSGVFYGRIAPKN